MKLTYTEMLKSNRWQRRRLEVLSLAGWRCVRCEAGGDEKVSLHVHHKIYRRGAKPWEYPDHELEVLCEQCHASIEQIKSRLSEALAILDQATIEQVLGYAEALVVAWQRDMGQSQELPSAVSAEHISGFLHGVAAHSNSLEYHQAFMSCCSSGSFEPEVIEQLRQSTAERAD